jgi:tetratricopeptide (TPR) repeat protein
MVNGSYPKAIDVLRRALGATSASSLTHAYALYDLGRSLRLAGQPQAAIPILQQRLRYPDQTDVVRRELALALQAAGAGTSGSGGARPAPGRGHDHGRGHNGAKHGGGGGD